MALRILDACAEQRPRFPFAVLITLLLVTPPYSPPLTTKSRNVVRLTPRPSYIVLFYFSCRLPAQLLFAYPRLLRCTAAPHHASWPQRR